MIRFNYLADPRHAAGHPSKLTFAIDNRIRGPLAALVAVVLLTATITIIQLARFHAAQRVYAVTSARLALGLAAVARIKPIKARIDAKERLAERVAGIRQSSLQNTAELAWIGNHLPHDAWLRTLRFEHGVYSLDGTSAHIVEVSSAMMALHDSRRAIVPRLVSLHDDATDDNGRVHYSLRLESRP